MALGGGRTELDIELTGEDQTRRMLEDAQKRMAELERRLRGLTDAGRENEDQTDENRSAWDRFSGRLGALGEGLEGPVEGLDKLFGGVDKVLGIFGNLSEIVQGVIDVYKFFTEESEEVKKANEKQKESLKALEEQAIATREAVKELAAQQAAAKVETRSEEMQILEDRLRLMELTGNEAGKQRVQAELEYAKEVDRVENLKVQFDDLTERRKQAKIQEDEANSKAIQTERTLNQLIQERKAEEQKLAETKKAIKEMTAEEASFASFYAKQEAEAKLNIKRLNQDIRSLTNDILIPEKERARQARETRVELDKQKGVLSGLLGIASQVADAVRSAIDFTGPKKPEVVKPPTSGGGGGKSRADIAREAEEAALREAERMIGAQENITKLAEREAIVRAAVLDEADLFEKLARKRWEVVSTLDSIPKDLAGDAEKAFAPFSEALKKQLGEIDKVLGSRVEFDLEIASPEEEDALLKALDTQKTAYDKLNESIGQNIVMQSKAQDESVKLLEAYDRGLPTEKLQKFQEGLGQLQEMSVPAFGEIGTVIGQVAAQFEKYKAGQTSITNATIQGASSIAGAIAKQVGGVKAEAAVRALFETAMGFATISNPAESAGHFTAAAMFGLVAGGVLKTGASSAGGQKAPPTKVASTTASSGSTGGGSITNVYNLQTGIVDGQSTARAFRQAEQQARNTGMASAGGW